MLLSRGARLARRVPSGGLSRFACGSKPLPPLSVRYRCALAGRDDPWTVLGVPRGSNIDECKQAYRQLALSLHPDVGGDATTFASVVQAYQEIEAGADGSPRLRGLRGVRSVGGVLVVSIEDLKRDPEYSVYTLCIALDRDETSPGSATDGTTSSAACNEVAAEVVHTVNASSWDSVADLQSLLQELLELPERLRHGNLRNRGGGHEVLYRGQLMAEHLLLADYELSDGDTLHFAVKRPPGSASGSGHESGA